MRSITCSAGYLPANVDGEGTAKAVKVEIEDWINAAADADPWLREHPLEWNWTGCPVAAEMPSDHPLVGIVLDTAAALGRAGKPSGLDAWHDAAHFTRWGETPTLSFGPEAANSEHSVEERVSIDSLIDHCAAVALAAMRWCGVARLSGTRPDPALNSSVARVNP